MTRALEQSAHVRVLKQSFERQQSLDGPGIKLLDNGGDYGDFEE